MSALGDRLRDITDPVPARTREHPLRNGALTLAVFGLAIYMALSHNIPFINGKPGYGLQANFASVNQVDNQTPVRVNGVQVGTVDKVGPGPDPRRSSEVSMRITDDDIVVHQDARATIRWRTILGGRMFIDLQTGSPRAPELEGPIPVAQTNNQTELDDVLQVYDGGTEQAQRDALAGADEGFSSPQTTQRAIKSLPDLDEVGKGLTPYQGTETGDLRKLVASTATTLAALGTDTSALQRFVTGARQTLGATATRRTELGRFLEESPPTLDSTLITMSRIRTTLDHLDPLVANLRPGARALAPSTNAATPALEQARLLLGEAQPLLRDLRPTFGDLRRTANAGVPIVNGLKPTVSRLNRVILPFLGQTDPVTEVKNFTAVGGTFSVLNMGAAEFDKIGYRIHLSTPAANNSVVSLYTRQLTRSCMSVAQGPIQTRACPALSKTLAYGTLGNGGKR